MFVWLLHRCLFSIRTLEAHKFLRDLFIILVCVCGIHIGLRESEMMPSPASE